LVIALIFIYIALPSDTWHSFDSRRRVLPKLLGMQELI